MTLINVITRDVYAARGPRGVYWSVLLDASDIVNKWGEYKHLLLLFRGILSENVIRTKLVLMLRNFGCLQTVWVSAYPFSRPHASENIA